MADEPATHNDMRSSSRDSKRDRDQRSKWKHTPPPADATLGIPAMPFARPMQRRKIKWSHNRGPHTSNGVMNHHAKMESQDRTQPGDEDVDAPGEGVDGVMYSFDREASPAGEVELDGLVDRAEVRFVERETERIVKEEYEVLDGEGEVRRKTRGRSEGGREAAEMDKIVREEYEVLDREGEVLKKG